MKKEEKTEITRAKIFAAAINEFGTNGYAAGYILNNKVFTNISINYMLLGVAFSTAFSNMIPAEKLEEATGFFHPVLAVCLLGAIVDLGAPLDYHLILGAGVYTFVYIVSRALGKYFGARAGASLMKMPEPSENIWALHCFLIQGSRWFLPGLCARCWKAGSRSWRLL